MTKISDPEIMCHDLMHEVLGKKGKPRPVTSSSDLQTYVFEEARPLQ